MATGVTTCVATLLTTHLFQKSSENQNVAAIIVLLWKSQNLHRMKILIKDSNIQTIIFIRAKSRTLIALHMQHIHKNSSGNQKTFIRSLCSLIRSAECDCVCIVCERHISRSYYGKNQNFRLWRQVLPHV